MKVKFFTLGCKVNQYETQGLKEKFISLGHEVTDKRADLYVINTCTVTHRADSKSKVAIVKAKKENPKAKVAVCGCLAQFNKDFIERTGADYIVSQNKKHLLPEVVLGLTEGSFEEKPVDDMHAFSITNFYNQRAFVKVQDGCDNFCSFCKIPYLRGPSRSKDSKKALDEIKKVSKAHEEIVLCGVNLSLYGRDLKPAQALEELVEKTLDLDSLGRLRLSSLEPFFVNKQLFSLLENPKLCPHFHFPFQYGDDRILKDMNKKETVSLYEEAVSRARSIRPDIAISCDIMVGFPGEDEKSFQNTVDFIKKVKPMRIHIFTFSPREKTKFSKMKIEGHKTIKKRHMQLKKLADEFSLEYKNKFINKELEAVAEQRSGDFTRGYTQNYIKVSIKGRLPLGKITRVKIKSVDKERVLAVVAG